MAAATAGRAANVHMSIKEPRQLSFFASSAVNRGLEAHGNYQARRQRSLQSRSSLRQRSMVDAVLPLMIHS